MPSLQSLLAFFGIAVLLALTPGPDNIFVLVQSAQRGWRAGLAIVAGLCSGIVVHSCAVALGLAAIITASPSAFTALKWCGALYLAWLAWGAWNAPVEARDVHASSHHQTSALSAKGAVQMWGRGFVMNLTNPKILIFFLALLPQFANPELSWPVSMQILLFGLIFMCAALLVFSSIAYFSGTFGRVLQKSARAQRLLNRLASVVFVGLAIRLASLQR